jgi:hypothetical protein
MFQEEKRVLFPFTLPRLFDLEGLGAGARLLQTIEKKHTKYFMLSYNSKKAPLSQSPLKI